MEYIADPFPELPADVPAMVAGEIAAAYPLSSLPILHSNPTATAKLYLDFDGAAAQSWGSYSVTATPAYDQDGSPTSFSDGEIASINTIWARVAQSYAPFTVDVTTENPGNLNNYQTEAVVIGGDGAWTGGQYGGIAYVGGFYNSASNVAWVFSKNLGSGNAKYTADASAHEAGHGFGLSHQSTYDASGNLVDSYNRGDSLRAPIMGVAYYAARGLWWNGPTSAGPTSYQDDLAKLTDGRNQWTYRADDHGSTLDAADPLAVSGNSITGSGIIERMADKDVYSFVTGAGTVSLSGQVAAVGPTLDLRLDLYNSSGTIVATADSSSLGETITANLAAGSYRLAVSSHGSYGDLGTYTVSGTIVATTALPAPSNLTAASSSTSEVSLNWLDNSSNEDGFRIERSTDGGVWSELASVAANSVSYTDAGLAAGTTNAYRVYAVSGANRSADSNVATVTTVPPGPATASAAAVSSSQIDVAWIDVAGETSYAVQRSANGIDGWTQRGTAAANATTYRDSGLASGTTYYYRVLAANASGTSVASPVSSATTLIAAVPNAPSNLAASSVTRNSAKLIWTDNSTNESGFKIERSTDGQNWKQVASVGAGVTTYTSGGLKRNKDYFFRVRAYNSVGNSAYSNVLSVRTAAAASSLAAFVAPAPQAAKKSAGPAFNSLAAAHDAVFATS